MAHPQALWNMILTSSTQVRVDRKCLGKLKWCCLVLEVRWHRQNSLTVSHSTALLQGGMPYYLFASCPALFEVT